MGRRPNPYLPGVHFVGGEREVGLPPLLMPADIALMLLPAVRAWVAEHRRQGATAKLAAAEVFIGEWEYLAALQRQAFAGESAGGAGAGSGGSSPHDRDEISAAQAAERLGCTPTWVGTLCRRRDIAGRKVGGVWLVEVASLVAYQRWKRHTAA